MQTIQTIHISTYPPEKCGIAAYVKDLISYAIKADPKSKNRVLAINGHPANQYDYFVTHVIDKHNRKDYTSIAEELNRSDNIDVISLQHEFGIFGGEEGSYVLDLLKAIKKPVVTTIHTINTQDPGGIRRKILREMSKSSARLVVISYIAKKILTTEYGADPRKVEVFHHGVHEFEETPEVSREILDLGGRTILSTVGLLRKHRGLEYVIKAMPKVAEKHPEALYVIAGSTQPQELENGREVYREQLEEETRKLGLENNVLFVNRFLPQTSLLRFIQASHICVTPYVDPKQVSSGILSFSMGFKKPIVSTPFLYAQEVLADGRGLLAEFEDSNSLADKINFLLDYPEEIQKIESKLEEYREHMLWKNVAKKYLRLFKEVA